MYGNGQNIQHYHIANQSYLQNASFLCSFDNEIKIHKMDKEIDKSLLRRERRRRIIIWGGSSMILTVAVALMLAGATPGVKSRDITLAAAEEGPLELTVAAAGRVVPAHEEIINSPVESRVLQIFAQPGDSVTAGMPLLQLDLEEEEMNLGKLRDAHSMQQQELRQLELSNRTSISDLEMQIKICEMNVERLRMEADNERRLDSIGSGTGERVHQAETAYAQGTLELQQLRLRLRNERLSHAASERGKRLSVNSAGRDISMMAKTLQRGSIPAPHDGILTFIISEIGGRVGTGEKVAVVSDLSSFKIVGEVAEGNSNQVQTGAKVTVRISGATLTGTVTNITPQATQGVVSFAVSLDNPRDSHLRSGGRAEMEVTYGFRSKVLRLKNGTYYRGPGEYQVFVCDGNNRLKRRKIKTGDCNREYVEITEGLRPGDLVVVSDMETHKNKKELKIIK